MTRIKIIFSRISSYVKIHKIISTIVAVIIVAGGFYTYKAVAGTPTITRYIIGPVTQGTILSIVNGTGQVDADQQLTVSPQASGQVTKVDVISGQNVKQGDPLIELDSTDAYQAVQNAELDLQNAQLSLQELSQNNTLGNLQAEDAVTQAIQSKQSAEEDLATSYDNGYTDTANAFVDIPDSITGMEDTLNNPELSNSWIIDSGSAISFKETALQDLNAANQMYEQTFKYYESTPRNAATSSIDSLISQTSATTKQLSQALGEAVNLVDYLNGLTSSTAKPSTELATDKTTLQGYLDKVNSDLSSLATIESNITSDNNTLVNSDQTIAEKQITASTTATVGDETSLQQAQLSVAQKQSALTSAQENLSYFTVRAPFDGVVAKISVVPGQQVSGGTAAITFVSTGQEAQISLNEIDVAKVKVGEKATLTFNAVPTISIAGTVETIDTVGTVSQGVVTYNVYIVLDTEDPSIKPGMSVSANIITDVEADTLMVPSTAIKTSGNTSYVQTIPGATTTDATGITSSVAPKNVVVTVGISDGTNTQILGGLSAGESIITKTTTTSAKTTATTATTARAGTSLLGGLGGGGLGGGGAAFRGGGGGAAAAGR